MSSSPVPEPGIRPQPSRAAGGRQSRTRPEALLRSGVLCGTGPRHPAVVVSADRKCRRTLEVMCVCAYVCVGEDTGPLPISFWIPSAPQLGSSLSTSLSQREFVFSVVPPTEPGRSANLYKQKPCTPRTPLSLRLHCLVFGASRPLEGHHADQNLCSDAATLCKVYSQRRPAVTKYSGLRVCTCVHVCARVCVRVAARTLMWRSDDSLW